MLLFSFCKVFAHNYYDLRNPKEKVAIHRVKDNSKESGTSFSFYSTDFSSVIENWIRGSIHNKLFNFKYFSVVNKSQINKLTKEDKFTLSNLLTKKAQIDIPALKKLNVNKGLIISITEFNKEEQKKVNLLIRWNKCSCKNKPKRWLNEKYCINYPWCFLNWYRNWGYNFCR